MSRVALLDVNVLVALFDPDHIHHEPAHRWFGKHRSEGWATCPVTENGCRPNSVHALLRRPSGNTDERDRPFPEVLCQWDLEFWPADFSLRDLRSVKGHALANRQIPDVYLLALARHRNGRLATFDRSMPLDGVEGQAGSHTRRTASSASVSPGARRPAQSVWRRAADRLADLRAAARARGEIHREDCHAVADRFMGMRRDNLPLRVVLGLQPRPSSAEIETAAASAVGLFLHGISTRPARDGRTKSRSTLRRPRRPRA